MEQDELARPQTQWNSTVVGKARQQLSLSYAMVIGTEEERHDTIMA
jgi:hypothetical protein